MCLYFQIAVSCSMRSTDLDVKKTYIKISKWVEMFDIKLDFVLLIGFFTFSNFVTSKKDGWLHWTQWSECPDLICSGERNKPLVRRSRECRNTVFGEDICGDETIEVEEKNCRPNIPDCTHEWTLWTNVS